MLRLVKPDDFDKDRDFLAIHDMVVNGKRIPAGATVDKTAFSVRRLRLLFDQRRIAMVTLPDIGPAAYLTDLTTEQLREWLVLRGQNPRRRASHASLMAMATSLLDAETKAA